MADNSRTIQVAIAGPLRRSFTYSVPTGMPIPHAGQRVVVSFGRAQKIGYSLGPCSPPAGVTLKPIVKSLDGQSLFPPDLLKFCLWMADYYFANPADCLTAALPPVLKAGKERVWQWTVNARDIAPSSIHSLIRAGRRLTPRTVQRINSVSKALFSDLQQNGAIIETHAEADQPKRRILVGYQAVRIDEWPTGFAKKKFTPLPFDGIRSRNEMISDHWTSHHLHWAVKAGLLEPVYDQAHDDIFSFITPRKDVDRLPLTDEQQVVIDNVSTAFGKGFSTLLLHGVTGSGKTLVYCHLAREVLAAGKTVLVLTPEITLSGTTLAYLRGFFGDTVTVIHSAMTERERLASWEGIRSGKYPIVVGPRSAIFAPLENLGLIVVDEEHDGSYKQDEPSPRFQGRDAAIMRAKLNGIPVLLGSASPSVESYHHAATGRYQLLTLTHRPAGATLPRIEVIDMRSQQVKGDLPFLSLKLKKAVEDRLRRGEQAILFLNRRGYSPMVKCGACGFVPQCPQCEVNLTFHKAGRKLICHYCGYLHQRYDACTKCGSTTALYLGAGTQKVEESIPRLFDGAKPLRFDSDSASGRLNAHRLLDEFAQQKFNLLLGTQMVTKGLDLPEVSLVGVLSADMGLDMPDFRASEKTFAKLLQVAGRSGRADKPGEVLIQTFYPEHHVIIDAEHQDYPSFFAREIKKRELHQFPPFSRLVRILLSGKEEKNLVKVTATFRESLERRLGDAGITAELLGPAPAPMALLKGLFRRHLLVKTRQMTRVTNTLTEWENQEARFGLPANCQDCRRRRRRRYDVIALLPTVSLFPLLLRRCCFQFESNQSCPAIACDVTPPPLEKHQQSIFKLDQVHQMYKQPEQPGRIPPDFEPPEIRYRLRPPDRRQHTLIEIPIRLHRLAGQTILYRPRYIPPFGHCHRRYPRQRLLALMREQREITDDIYRRPPRNRQIRFNHYSPRPIDMRVAHRHHSSQFRCLHARRPQHRLRLNSLRLLSLSQDHAFFINLRRILARDHPHPHPLQRLTYFSREQRWVGAQAADPILRSRMISASPV